MGHAALLLAPLATAGLCPMLKCLGALCTQLVDDGAEAPGCGTAWSERQFNA